MDANIQKKLFVKEGLTMNDCTFYQALKQCYTNNKNCKRCCLYGYGYRDNDQCIKMLEKEIDDRKREAYRKDEEVNP